MSDRVNRYQVLLTNLQPLMDEIQDTHSIDLMEHDTQLQEYQEKAIMILEECLGSDAVSYIEEIENAIYLKPFKDELEFRTLSLSTILKRLKLNILRELERLEERLKIRGQLESVPATKATSKPVKALESKPISNRVFIVHGHDEAMQARVARTLTQLKLDPIILHEQPNRGRTIIEKFEEEAADVGFAVVLLSPDDDGRKAGEEDFHPRARQNVVLELGFFFGKLGRGRVVALYNDAKGFELPSDISGVIYIPYDRRGAWRMALCKELQACGYKVSADDLP